MKVIILTVVNVEVPPIEQFAVGNSTRSPSIGWVGQNAAPLNVKTFVDILCHYDFSTLYRPGLFYAFLSSIQLHFLGRPEAASNIISGVALDNFGVGVRAKRGHSRSNRS